MTRIRRTILATTISGTLLLGGASTAFAHGSHGKPTPERTEQICDNHEKIATSLNNRKAATQKRITNLQKAVDRAKAKGHAKAAARLQKALDRAKKHLGHIETRIAKLAEFVAANCD